MGRSALKIVRPVGSPEGIHVIGYQAPHGTYILNMDLRLCDEWMRGHIDLNARAKAYEQQTKAFTIMAGERPIFCAGVIVNEAPGRLREKILLTSIG